MRVGIDRIEYYLPPHTEDGSVLKKDNPDWRVDAIEEKTGIKNRHLAEKNQTATDLGVLAAEKLLASGVDRAKISSLIFVTQSPEYALPTSACLLQNKLGLSSSCMSFDVNLGCSGFVYGLAMGASLIETGVAQNTLLVCGETYSKYIDSSDRTCRPIFSDGAAATLLLPTKSDSIGPFEMGTDGSGAKNLIVENSGTKFEAARPSSLFMDGPKVFMFTMAKVPLCVTQVLEKAKMKIEDVDLFVFHQASKVVMENLIRRLELPEAKVYLNYQQIGNTVSASIPIALKDAVNEKRLKKGDTVMLVGFGVGYSWGACLLEWGAS